MNIHFYLMPSPYFDSTKDSGACIDRIGSYNLSLFTDIVFFRKIIHCPESGRSRYIFTDGCDVSIVELDQYANRSFPYLPKEFSIDIIDTTSSVFGKQVHSEIFELFKDKIWHNNKNILIGDY